MKNSQVRNKKRFKPPSNTDKHLEPSNRDKHLDDYIMCLKKTPLTKRTFNQILLKVNKMPFKVYELTRILSQKKRTREEMFLCTSIITKMDHLNQFYEFLDQNEDFKGILKTRNCPFWDPYTCGAS